MWRKGRRSCTSRRSRRSRTTCGSTGRTATGIIRFSSDADLTQKIYWDLAGVDVHVYDLRENVVVSLGEVPGSSKYVTRDWAARALFNCIALGQKVTMPPAAPRLEHRAPCEAFYIFCVPVPSGQSRLPP